MKASIIVAILKAIFCEAALKAWLEKQAQLTDTPLDNMAVKVIYMLFSCEDKK